MSIFREIFSTGFPLSSKRIFGGFGFIVLLSLLCYSTFAKTELPDAYELVFVTCASLLGVESVVNAFGWKGNKQQKKEDEADNRFPTRNPK
jgi:hypothetical protein